MFALVAVAIGASLGLVIARILERAAAAKRPTSVTAPEPNRLTNHQLEDLLAPYEPAA